VFWFKNYIAIFLLLLFVRVLVPETAVLALHNHEHTEEQFPAKKNTGLKLDQKHQHCQIDELFNAPFTPVQAVIIQANNLTYSDTYSASHSFIWKFTFPNNTDLRGPPLA
jgi:hypothetical protein